MAKKITIFTGLVKIGPDLVGTAVVYREIAHLLRMKGFEVSMVVPEPVDNPEKGIAYYVYEPRRNKKIIRQSDIVFFGAYPPTDPLEYAYKNKKIIVSYLWSLAPIGSLEFRDVPSREEQDRKQRLIVDAYNRTLLYSDKVFCRSEKARDFILGSLAALGRANIYNYGKERNFRNIAEVAPFGIPQTSPHHTKNIYRGVISGVGKNDFLLLWNGGVWNWNDATGLVEIMNYIRRRDKKIKLIFQGFHNPQSKYALSAEAKKARRLAEKRSLINNNIFITSEWINYDERGNYLTEVDAGITLSPNIPEANFFIKTRYYDYIWAGKPIILNEFEAFAPEVKNKGLGLVLTGDYRQMAEDIIRFSRNKKSLAKIRKNLLAYKKGRDWRSNLGPVVDFCQSARHSADRRLAKRNI